MNQKASFSSKLISSPYIIWMIIFIVFPLLVVAYYSFTDANGNFSLSNFSNLSIYASTFTRSIWFGIVATLISLIISYPLAYIICQMHISKQRTIIFLVMLPMWMNFLLSTYSWMILL